MCCYVSWGGAFCSCSKNTHDEEIISLAPTETKSVSPQLTEMFFSADKNPFQLIEDQKCEIIGDSVVVCWIRHIIDNKKLVSHIAFNGDSVALDGIIVESDVSQCDFRKPVILTVFSGNDRKEYTVYVHSFTGLPIVSIETENRKAIVSRDDYIDATFRLEENVTTRSSGDVIESKCQIKGRGNSSWIHTSKKSYTLKFPEKVSLFDDPKDKSWVLIGNSFDKTMLRNYLAYYIGSLSKMDYSPRFHFIDLILNGSYWGTYMLGDKLKISKHRVNVGDDGYLLEIDERAEYDGDIYFRTPHLWQPINIKDPDVEVGSEAYNYIKDFVITAEAVLFSEEFKDPINGWQKFIDIDTFLDWYIIHEIAKNYDALSLYTSCYMNLKRGGKLKMGPIWDFDVTFGNNTNPQIYPVDGLVYNSTWYCRLLEDPLFRNKAKERFTFFYERRNMILNMINETACYLKYSVEENDNKWSTLYEAGFGNYNVWGCYMNEVNYLKNWFLKRMEWLNNYFQQQ